MLNTLFARNWDADMPDLNKYKEKKLISNGMDSFYVQNSFEKAYMKWTSSIGADTFDLIHILNVIEIKGWVTYVGNFDEEDNTFVIFTSSGVYFARLDHGNSFDNVALRVGEQRYDCTFERNYYISRPMVSGMLRVMIESCKIKNAFGMIRADYTSDSKSACASLRIRRDHVDYDVEIFCKKERNQARIIESNAMRHEMEMFFLMSGSDNAYELYHSFVKEIFIEGILPSDIEIMKIKVYRDAQFISEALFEKAELKNLCFTDHDELWRIKSDGTWDFAQSGDVISWVWKESKKGYELMSNFAVPESENECTEQTMEYAYVVQKAAAYLRTYFDVQPADTTDNV